MTATLRNMVQEAVQDAVPGSNVVTRAPRKENDPAQSLVSVFLYQVTRNAEWRNFELPVRRADGSLAHRPQVALDLHYIFTFYGDEEALVPQLLLGRTAMALHAFPYPPPRYMPRRPIHPGSASRIPLRLWDSGLEEQLAHLQIIPEPLRYDELSKLWPLFFQVPYALSAGYRVSVVLITNEEQPEPPLPVHQPTLYTPSQDLPEIESVVPQQAEYSDDLTLTLRGRNLAGSENAVVIGGRRAELVAGNGGVVAVRLPAGLEPGIQEVQVARDVVLERGEPPRRLFESNLATFILRPVIQGLSVDPSTSEILVHLAPDVAEGQSVHLLLNEIGGDSDRPTSLSLPGKASGPDEPLRFRSKAVQSGTYLARVRVRGVTTPLRRDPDPRSPHFDRFVEPRLEVP